MLRTKDDGLPMEVISIRKDGTRQKGLKGVVIPNDGHTSVCYAILETIAEREAQKRRQGDGKKVG